MSIKLYQDNIVCQIHELDVCLSCNINWKDHNEIAHGMDKKWDERALKSQVQELKEKGNACFKSNRASEAIEHYTQGLMCIWSLPLVQALAFQFNKDELLVLLINRSAAYALNNQWVEALVDAEIALRLKKNWPKAWFRKGKALMGLERYKEAKKAYEMGLLYEENIQELRNALKQAENNSRECI